MYSCTRQSLASVSNNIAYCEPRRADGRGMVSPVIIHNLFTEAPPACPSPGEDILYKTILAYPFYTMTRYAIGYRCACTWLVDDGSIQLPWIGDDDELEYICSFLLPEPSSDKGFPTLAASHVPPSKYYPRPRSQFTGSTATIFAYLSHDARDRFFPCSTKNLPWP